jgi:hypothetical protein
MTRPTTRHDLRHTTAIQEEEFGVSEDTLPPVSSSSKADLIHQDLIDGRHNTPVSLFYSLHTMRNIFFWFLILGNFAGISSAVFIITCACALVRVSCVRVVCVVCVCGG